MTDQLRDAFNIAYSSIHAGHVRIAVASRESAEEARAYLRERQKQFQHLQIEFIVSKVDEGTLL